MTGEWWLECIAKTMMTTTWWMLYLLEQLVDEYAIVGIFENQRRLFGTRGRKFRRRCACRFWFIRLRMSTRFLFLQTHIQIFPFGGLIFRRAASVCLCLCFWSSSVRPVARAESDLEVWGLKHLTAGDGRWGPVDNFLILVLIAMYSYLQRQPQVLGYHQM